MLSRLKKINIFRKESPVQLDLAGLQEQLTDGLVTVMENAYSGRQADLHNSNLSDKDIGAIIDGYAQKNMLLAAASSIVPGPFGILGCVPELMLNFSNQMNMIYDLGCATGKENFINKDILLDIPIAAFGGNTNLAQLQNTGNLLDAPTELLTQKATTLGKSIIERTLKKSVVQFIPVAGPIVMGTWAKFTTKKISKLSTSFLTSTEIYVEHFKPDETPAIQKQLQIEKIKGLANLIEANNEINESQIEFIGTIIENSLLTDPEKDYYLEEALKTGSQFEIDIDLLKTFEEDDDLLLQLIIMARRSGSIDQYEWEYIHKLAEQMGYDDAFVESLV